MMPKEWEAVRSDTTANILGHAGPIRVDDVKLIERLREPMFTSARNAFEQDTIAKCAAAALEANTKRIAELEAEVARLRVDGERYLAAFNWALGCGDEFSTRELGQGPFYWRSQLAERAGLSYNGKEYAAKEQS